ncbi:MAG: DUF3268 family zinc-finger domain-containing protein [Oscillospiraceae bacterium]|nr:DUF3268 family zinc-finger domain-containing protein [Oscillospiraceae bacterium]
MGRHNHSSKNKKKWDYTQTHCPYCGHKLVFRTAEQMGIDEEDGVNFWACSNYPECDAYVRTNRYSQKPRGTVANGKLRQLRQETHKVFNRLYESGYMKKAEAYLWLGNVMGMGCTRQQVHIGQFSEYACKIVIEEVNKFIQNNPQYFK